MGCGNSKSSFPRNMTKNPRMIEVEIDNQVVRVSLYHVRNENKKLPRLIKDYFETSRLNLDFCIALENLLIGVRDRQRELQVDGNDFQEEVKMFKDMEHQFDDVGWISFIQSVRRKQLITAEILSAELKVLQRRPVPTTVGVTPKHTRPRRIYLNALRPQLRILRSMIHGTETAISLLDESLELFDIFRKMISQLVRVTEALEEEQHTEIMDKASECMQLAIKAMGEHADSFTRKITKIRTSTLNMVYKF